MGRVLIVKTLGLSKFSFLASVLHIPEYVIKKVNTILFQYIWKGKRDKVKRDIMIQDYKYGGCRMVDFKMIVESAKMEWIKRFLNNDLADWKIFMFEFCKQENLQIYFQGNFDESEIPTDIPQYYLDAIKTWRSIKYDYITEKLDLEQQLIWYNKCIKIDNKSVYNERLFACGIWVFRDLFDNGNLIPFNTWLKRGAYAKDFLTWMGIVKCLPQYIKTMAKDAILCDKTNFKTRILTVNKTYKSIEDCQQRDIKDIIRMRKYSLFAEEDFKAKAKYAVKLNIEIPNWENIFSLPISLKCNNKLKELQFKILHRIFPVNQFLFKIKKVESPKCFFCEMYDETLEHLFADCMVVKTFWLRILALWNVFNGSAYKIFVKDILLGCELQDSANNYALNLLLLYGKMFIVRCRFNKSDINIHLFRRFVMSHYVFRLNKQCTSTLQTYEQTLTDFCSNFEV